MPHVDHASTLGQPVEAINFTSGDGAELHAQLNLQAGLMVSVEGAGGAAPTFRCDPAQADALGRWLVAKAAEYRGAAHSWVMVPAGGAMPRPGEVAGFDTLDQALAMVAGLSGLETARAMQGSARLIYARVTERD